MTSDWRGFEAGLTRHFLESEPGPPPLGLRARVEVIPETISREAPLSRLRLVRPAIGLIASLALVALAIRLLPIAGTGPGSGATPAPTATFDPTLEGIGAGPAFDASGPWILVLVAAAVLAMLGLSARRWWRLAWFAPAVGLLAYAGYGTFAPIDVSVTGEGPGLNVTRIELPLGVEGSLYYETAKPHEPFSFGILLIGGTRPPVRIEGLVDDTHGIADYGGLSWRSVWLDAQADGGMTGPARPFQPFDMPQNGQALWLVGRASSCALGVAPTPSQSSAGGSTGSTWLEAVQLNVSVYGWPRVIEVPLPRIIEPIGDCGSPASPGPSGAP